MDDTENKDNDTSSEGPALEAHARIMKTALSKALELEPLLLEKTRENSALSTRLFELQRKQMQQDVLTESLKDRMRQTQAKLQKMWRLEKQVPQHTTQHNPTTTHTSLSPKHLNSPFWVTLTLPPFFPPPSFFENQHSAVA